jgi:hypothetical protein
MLIMQLIDALFYTSDWIMKLHDTVLATGTLWVGFYWTIQPTNQPTIET